MKIKNNFLYYSLKEDGIDEKIFEIDVENSFVQSDIWLYDKMIRIDKVFPNLVSSTISAEQTGFYTSMVIASILEGQFEEEFLDCVATYDFNMGTEIKFVLC